MNRPTRYKVLRADSISDLTDQVNEHIKVGWIPQGGVEIYQDRYYQAMCSYNVLGPYITRVEKEETLREFREPYMTRPTDEKGRDRV